MCGRLRVSGTRLRAPHTRGEGSRSETAHRLGRGGYPQAVPTSPRGRSRSRSHARGHRPELSADLRDVRIVPEIPRAVLLAPLIALLAALVLILGTLATGSSSQKAPLPAPSSDASSRGHGR